MGRNRCHHGPQKAPKAGDCVPKPLKSDGLGPKSEPKSVDLEPKSDDLRPMADDFGPKSAAKSVDLEAKADDLEPKSDDLGHAAQFWRPPFFRPLVLPRLPFGQKNSLPQLIFLAKRVSNTLVNCPQNPYEPFLTERSRRHLMIS